MNNSDGAMVRPYAGGMTATFSFDLDPSNTRMVCALFGLNRLPSKSRKRTVTANNYWQKKYAAVSCG